MSMLPPAKVTANTSELWSVKSAVSKASVKILRQACSPPPSAPPATIATANLSNGTIELAGTTLTNGYQFIPDYSAAAGATPATATLIHGPVNVAMIMAPTTMKPPP